MTKKKAAKKKTTKRGVIGGSEVDPEVDPEVGEGEEEEATVHVFEGEPLAGVKVGDYFSSASNPGAAAEVTEEFLKELIARKKVVDPDAEVEEGTEGEGEAEGEGEEEVVNPYRGRGGD
jgi:hypothetical protein